MPGKILVVDDHAPNRELIREALTDSPYGISEAGTALEALEHLRRHKTDLVITDVRMPGLSGVELLKRLNKDYPDIVVILMSAMNADTYAEDQINPIAGFAGIVGRSSALREVLQQVEMVAGTDSTVLLLGETGTGKELIARGIHERSGRKSQALVKVNCAAIPGGLLESELFGHERGAFTGAITQKIGRFELADQGSLFLDEIGDIPLELQPKLLRVLQEREFDRLGSTVTRKVNVRVISQVIDFLAVQHFV